MEWQDWIRKVNYSKRDTPFSESRRFGFSGSGQEKFVGSFEHGNGTLISIECVDFFTS
jgi:hypothetical protein